MRSERHVHLVGVAGVGMSALAQALRAEGVEVSGSDRRHDAGAHSEVLRKLRHAGVRLVAQDGSAIGPATQAVIVSTAIEDQNPDLLQARALNCPVQHRAEALAALLTDRACIAITGTSGKSTVTGMTGWVLECLGAQPTVVNGAPVINWRDDVHIGNFRTPGAAVPTPAPSVPAARAASRPLWIVEADESDRSLLNLHPDWAVITNVSKDHFSVAESTALFEQFERQATRGTINMLDAPVLDAFAPDESGSRFRYRGIDFSIAVPGRHNAANAVCCITICERLGYGLEAIRDALRLFRGMERRLERVGRVRGITVVDDYAHNPAKIRASWEAMAATSRRIVAVWRPHGFGPLRTLMNDLVALFRSLPRAQDRLYILPVYDAGGSADRRLDSDQLVNALTREGASVMFAPDFEALAHRMADEAAPGDTIMTMGARDPELPALARRILSALRRNDA